MKNVLTKDTRISYQPGSPYVPGDPGQPYLPARWVTEQVYQLVYPKSNQLSESFSGSGGLGKIFWAKPDSNQGSIEYNSGRGWTPQTGYASAKTSYPSYQLVSKQVWVPAQPYIPPTPPKAATAGFVTTDFNLGWNSGARSKAVLVYDGGFNFSISPSASGVVIGLNTEDTGYGFTEIKHGIYATHGTAYIMENGQKGAMIGSFTAEDIFSVSRRNGVVTYLKNNVPVATSSTPSEGPVVLDVSMYSGGDTVFDPVLVAESSAHGSFLPLSGMAGNIQYAFAAGEFAPLTGSAREFKKSEGVFLPLAGMASNKVYGAGQGAFSALTGQAGMNKDELTPTYAVASGAFAFLTGAASGLIGTVGRQENAEFQPFKSLSGDKPYAEAASEFQPLTGFAQNQFGHEEVIMSSLALSLNPMIANSLISVLMSSTGQVTGAISFDLLMDAELSSTGQASTTFDLDSAIEATILSVISARTSLGMGSAGDTCWVVNADTGASSRYEGFEFNSFATLDGQLYATREDGLYRVGADDDAGEPIRAMISLGRQTFGSTHLKGLTAAYLGVSSTDTMYLKVVVNDGNEYIYRARRNDEFMKTQRIDTGKGLRANYFDFEIYNSDGSDFELDSVEFAPVQLSRRI